MDSYEDLDPEYLCTTKMPPDKYAVLTEIGILPKFLEPTAQLLTYEGLCVDSWPCFLLLLSRGIVKGFGNIYSGTWPKDGPPSIAFQEATKHYDVANLQTKDKLISFEDGRFAIFCSLMLSTLQYIGLDIHGGLERLVSLMRECMSTPGTRKLPASSILVIDATIAEQWFDLGHHIENPKLLQDGPQTFNEAFDLYAKAKTLIPNETRSGKSDKAAEADIAANLGSGKFSHLLWEFEREKFRLHVRRKLRDAMIDKAMEERVSIHSLLRKTVSVMIADLPF
jgi:hypothetical protein